MDLEKLKETDIWVLYEQGRDFCRTQGMFRDTDTNYRMYNGNQWEGVIVKGIEPIQENFIKPIVKYKVGNITSNLWQINFSSENFENEEFRETADSTCEMLNRKARKTWEKDGMDYKIKRIAKDSAINDEGIMYTMYDMENQEIINEVMRKNIAIASQDYIGDSEDGINIDDLKDNQMAGGDEVPPAEEEIHEVVEQDAEFPGGQAALLKYIRDNVKYPAIALEQDLQGMVILRFVVERDGSVGEVQIKKSLSAECDREAIRVVKSLPRFIPAKQSGRPVRKWFTVPVRFIIQ